MDKTQSITDQFKEMIVDAGSLLPQQVLKDVSTVLKDRQGAYGSSCQAFIQIASLWTILLGHDVTPRQVALCMVALKLVRETKKHKRDNALDIAGYAAFIPQLTCYEEPTDDQASA